MENEDYWTNFFVDLGVEEMDASSYAKTFTDQRISKKILYRLTDEKLRSLGVEPMGYRELVLDFIETQGADLILKPFQMKKTETTSMAGVPNNDEKNESKSSKDSDSPKKKKSKVDEFLEDIKGSRDIIEIVAKASITITVLENSYKIEKKKNDEVRIPLFIRDMAVIIENECPILHFHLPNNVSFVSHKDFTNSDIYRTYQFGRILSQYKTSNLYVTELYETLENDFKNYKNISEIEKKFIDEFETYKLQFCKSVVTAILAANKLQAHIVDVGVVKNLLSVLSVFSSPIDRFMVIFYNALSAHSSDDSQVDDP